MDLSGRKEYRKLKIRLDFLSQELFCLVTLLVIGIEVASAVTNPQDFQISRFEVGTRYCDFSSSERIYNITDLLLCMNELASSAVATSRKTRSSEDGGFPLSNSRRGLPYPPYQSPQYPYSGRRGNEYPSYYDRRPNPFYQRPPTSQGEQSAYYDGGSRYPFTPEQPFSLGGGSGAGLFEALTSISQYDDLKCVPRLLCEAATGVIPGNSGYKQSYGDFGTNSLIRLLTALDIGESSPLLTFGKSALTGYTSRGNPSVCYREYPKCPRNNADLVNYLNNHNGGFFRFFGKNRGSGSQGNYYRGAPRGEPAPPPGLSGPEADRTGTGELKFDNLSPLLRRDFAKSFFPDRREMNETNKVNFPEESLQGEQSLNRVSKSLSNYQEMGNNYQNPSFFPQDRKDQESNMLYVSTPGQFSLDQNMARSSRMMGSPKARLYLPDDPSNETISTFTFPDGQKVQINVGFSKLFSEGYKKALRRSFANDHSPQPVNFEGFSMVNLAEMYPNDRSRLDLQVVHPCDMICHDTKGTPVQFNQILLHSGSLSTLMAPDQPILDLSVPIPCEVMCIDRRGERRRLSTTLNQVLKTGPERGNQPDGMGHQDTSETRDYRSLNQRQSMTKPENLGNAAQKRPTRQFPGGVNIQRHQSLNDKFEPRKLDYSKFLFAAIPPDRRTISQPQRKARAPKIREAGEIENNANSVNANDKAASMPQGSIIIGGGPMPFFGAPIPFMGLAEISQGTPAFIPQGPPLPLGLTMQPMQAMPLQPEGGMFQPLGMMPMFPGLIPIMDPLLAGITRFTPVTPPPTILCYPPTCPGAPRTPVRVLMMCGGVLYFIPSGLFIPLPVCAVILDTGNGANQAGDSKHTPQDGSGRPGGPSGGLTGKFGVIPSATTHPFRQPEGEDYPQESCLEGESWNLDINECVPMKYDKDIETDYTHLPGSPWSGVTRKPLRTHKFKKRKKLVIITDKGNITYIKAI